MLGKAEATESRLFSGWAADIYLDRAIFHFGMTTYRTRYVVA